MRRYDAPTSILALDLATRLGWARGTLDGPTAWGDHTLPSSGNDIGIFLNAYKFWLDREISSWGVDMIVFESPILPAKTQITTLRKLYALPGVTEMVCRDRQTRVMEANLSNIRSHFLGKGQVPRKGPDIKAATVKMCRVRGWKAHDHNAADALALFDFVVAVHRPSTAIRATPMFGGAV